MEPSVSSSARSPEPLLRELEALRQENQALAARIAEQEREHRDRDRQLREAQRVGRLGSWSWEPGGAGVCWSEELCRIYGVPACSGEVAFSDYVSLIHPEDRERVLGEVDRAMREGGAFEFRHRIVRPDGEVRVVQGRGERETAPDGAPARMFGTVQDVTEQEAAEAALRRAGAELERRVEARTAELEQAEQRFRAIVEASPTPLLLSRVSDGMILFANDRLERFLGVGPGSLVGRPTSDFYHDPSDRPEVIETIRRQGWVRDLELRIRKADGTPRWVALSVQRLVYDGEPALATALLDITERKGAEEALRESEESYRGLFDNLTELVYLQDLQGRFVNVNEAVVRAYGYSREEIVGQTPDLLAAPGRVDVAATMERFRRAVAGEPQRFDWWGRRKDGTVFPKEVVLKRSTYFGQDVVIAVARDISARVRAEAALRESEALKRGIVESALDSIISIDDAGRILEFNPAAERTFGYRADEVRGRPIAEVIIPPGLREAHTEGMIRHRQTGETHVLGQRIEVPALRADGTEFPVELAISSVPLDDGREVFTAYLRDISERKEAEAALRRSEEHFRLLIENSSDIATILDADGVSRYQSPSIERVLGYSAEELTGRSAFERIHPEDAPIVRDAIADTILRPGTTRVAEFRYLHRDGSWRVLEATGRTLLPDSAEAGIVVNSRDVTERVEAARTLRLQKTLLEAQGEASIDGILVVSGEGRILSHNHRFVEMWGIPPEAVESRSDDETLRAVLDRLADPDAFLARVEHLYAHPDERARDEIALRDGRVFDRYSAPVTSSEGEHYGRIWFFRDVTGQKRHAEELEQARQEAEDARAQAEAANQAKSHFLANMSHELRTPLNAIIGYAEMLVEDAEDQGFGSLVPDLQKIRTAGRHLLGLINDILDLSKIEAGRMELYLEEFEVAPLLEHVRGTIRPLVDEKRNRLLVEPGSCPGRMRSDPTKVRQILFNLLSNAAKFTEEGTITLAVERRCEEEGEWLIFRVEDTGIGMTREQMDRLFRPFTQADASTTRRYGGTGLGLTITRRFVEMLGGDIRVDSVPGAGTTFTLRLPAASAAPPPDAARRAPAPERPAVPLPSPEPRRDAPLILAIDDDPASCDVVRRTLTREGFRVLCASGGDEGLRQAREARPDLITLDVLMPEMSGWEVLARLKADPVTADIPVVMVTVMNDRRLGFSLGAADYLVKPVERERMVGSVCRLVDGPAPGEDGRPVLLVEDDPASRDRIRRMLEAEGWPVVEVEGARLEPALLDEHRPALLILDLLTPEADGFAFLEAIRARPEWASLPVLVLTAREPTDEDARRLSGRFEKVLRRGSARRFELLTEIRRLLHSG